MDNDVRGLTFYVQGKRRSAFYVWRLVFPPFPKTKWNRMNADGHRLLFIFIFLWVEGNGVFIKVNQRVSAVLKMKQDGRR